LSHVTDDSTAKLRWPLDDAKAEAEPGLRRTYDTWSPQVKRWVRSLGGPAADVEDLAQEVFIVVDRKWGSFDGRNLGGWLFRITARTVSDYRRRSWFRRLFHRAPELTLLELEHPSGTPEEALRRKQDERQLYALLDKISEKRRTAFVLFEIEGRTGEEIAELLDIPVATVWTRLHHARKQFLELVEEWLRQEEPR
jgi:RNA polymerase sigma-70 factor (ECF subfamily)